MSTLETDKLLFEVRNLHVPTLEEVQSGEWKQMTLNMWKWTLIKVGNSCEVFFRELFPNVNEAFRSYVVIVLTWDSQNQLAGLKARMCRINGCI